MLYHNRATLETVVGGSLVVLGTIKIMSKAREACEIADEIEYKQMQIRRKDANEDWTCKKDRSREQKGVLKYAAVSYTKCYGFGVGMVLGGLALEGLGFCTEANELKIMTATAASYAATLGTVKERVIADQGEAKWQEYLLGPQCETVEVKEDGTIVQKIEPVDNPNRNVNLPPHCYFFDEACPAWEKDPKMNRDFLEDHQRWLSERLWAEGFLWTNDILRDLKLPLVKSGWTSGIMAVDEHGNRNYVDLGLGAMNPSAQAFRDGIEPSIILQLNVEDNITDKVSLKLI